MPQCFVTHTVHFLYPSLHLMFDHSLPPMMLPNYARNAREQAHGNLHALCPLLLLDFNQIRNEWKTVVKLANIQSHENQFSGSLSGVWHVRRDRLGFAGCHVRRDRNNETGCQVQTNTRRSGLSRAERQRQWRELSSADTHTHEEAGCQVRRDRHGETKWCIIYFSLPGRQKSRASKLLRQNFIFI